MGKPLGFLKDGLSIDETKTSVLILALIMSLTVALFKYYINGIIGDNLTTILQTLILSIAGVNSVNVVSSTIRKLKI